MTPGSGNFIVEALFLLTFVVGLLFPMPSHQVQQTRGKER
jgi:hypothetical protein